jgi:hypothetical protein
MRQARSGIVPFSDASPHLVNRRRYLVCLGHLGLPLLELGDLSLPFSFRMRSALLNFPPSLSMVWTGETGPPIADATVQRWSTLKHTYLRS